MKPDEILLSDLSRIFLGQTPPLFLLEVVARAVLFFVMIILAMRLLGRRVASQYTLIELSAVIALAGTIGVPLLDDKRGLLPPLLIIGGIVALQHLLGILSVRNRRLDRLLTGDARVALSDGRLDLASLQSTALSREKLFSLLRGRGVQQLGQLSRVYIEPSGALTLVWSDTPNAGLAIVPENDSELRAAMRDNEHRVCMRCGQLEDADFDAACRACEASQWAHASVALED
ncbi:MULTISPECIES: DUF421 domain-containing protein [Pantoea]|uniref:DUF421 domain-containing protein n=1 Tax=Pantoea TaxID=53335 RepID=UPI00069EA96F|nr:MULTISPECIES: YetF domain-containing protein [Pantoea]MBS6435382.1 DUF421 domain-containing protein [Pantoea sp.]MDU2727487.1 DUF421 domain-containing protein [Pantoea sp.]